MRRLITVLSSVVLVTAGCSDATSGGEPRPGSSTAQGTPEGVHPDPGDGWVRLVDSPLSPREGAAVVVVGDEVVVVGGYAGPPCPPGADCPMQPVERDGAAYDLETATWRRIADAPQPLGPWASTAVVDVRLFVVGEEGLLTWDSRRDSWAEAPMPADVRWSSLVADGARLLAVSGSDERGIRADHVYDTTTDTWSTLPTDPLKPSFDRSLTPTPSGLVLTAKSIREDGGPADPAVLHVAILPPGSDTWRTLPVLDQLGGWWTWTGQRLVDPTLGGADGGQVNGYGRLIPYGGRLDPATGTWSPLPDAPGEDGSGWPVQALSGPRIAAGGWFYDDATGTWTEVPRPEGAPAHPGPAVWAEDTLVVYGGTDWDSPGARSSDPASVWSTGVWAHELP